MNSSIDIMHSYGSKRNYFSETVQQVSRNTVVLVRNIYSFVLLHINNVIYYLFHSSLLFSYTCMGQSSFCVTKNDMRYCRYARKKLDTIINYNYSDIFSGIMQFNIQDKEDRIDWCGSSRGEYANSDSRRKCSQGKIGKMLRLKLTRSKFISIRISPPAERLKFKIGYVIDADGLVDIHLVDEYNLLKYKKGEDFRSYASTLFNNHHEIMTADLVTDYYHLIIENKSNVEIDVRYQIYFI